jgi:hypothetical protein
MNCKQGDLAIAVTACFGKRRNIGTLVRINSLHSASPPVWNYTILNWCVCDGVNYPPGTEGRSDDKYLRPLHDNDGEDEILRIAGYPNKETA